MASLDIPLDIVNQHQPPKSKEQVHMDGEDTFVPEAIVSLLNKSVMAHDWND